MPPRATVSSASLASTHARLQTTLATLESERLVLLISLSFHVPPDKSTTSNSPKSPTTATTSTDSDTPANEIIMAFANKTVKNHIRQLHTYNETKDIAMGFLGMIADKREVRVVDVMEEFGVTAKD